MNKPCLRRTIRSQVRKQLSTKKKVGIDSRYKCQILNNDFSRDVSGDENIGIGDDDDEDLNARGILFDDEDLFGDK